MWDTIAASMGSQNEEEKGAAFKKSVEERAALKRPSVSLSSFSSYPVSIPRLTCWNRNPKTLPIWSRSWPARELETSPVNP